MLRKAIAPEALLALRRQLGTLPPRSAERRRLIQEAAVFYGVSEPTLGFFAQPPKYAVHRIFGDMQSL